MTKIGLYWKTAFWIEKKILALLKGKYYLPSFHSRVAWCMKPKSSSVVTALGFKSFQTGFCFMLTYVRFSVLKIWGEGGKSQKKINTNVSQMESKRFPKSFPYSLYAPRCSVCAKIQKGKNAHMCISITILKSFILQILSETESVRLFEPFRVKGVTFSFEIFNHVCQVEDHT